MEVSRKVFSGVLLLLLVLVATELGPMMVAEAKKCVGPSDSFGDGPCYSNEDIAKCETACRNDGYEPGYCSETGVCICVAECG